MLIGLMWTLATGLIWFGVGVVQSQAAQRQIDRRLFFGLYSASITALAWATLPDYGVLRVGAVPQLPSLAVVMLAAGVTSLLGTQLLQKALSSGHQAASWTIGQSAMVLPFLAGVFLFGEPLSTSRLAGMLCILVSLVAFGLVQAPGTAASKVSSDQRWFWLALGAFLLIGVSQVFTLLPSHWANWADTARLRIPLVFSGGFILTVGPLLRNRRLLNRRTTLMALLLTAAVFPGQILLYRAVDALSAVGMTALVYPVAVGTCILGFALYSAVVVREGLNGAQVVGIVLGAIGISLIAM
jgi:uncharacterized membrane protein